MFFSYGVYSPQSLHPIYPHKCRFPTCLSFSRLVRLILQRIRHVDISKLEITYLWLFESVIQSSRSYFDQLSLVWPPMPPMDCLHHSISTTTAQIDHVIVRLADLLVSGMTLHTIRNVLLDITRFTYLRVDTVANTVASAHAKALPTHVFPLKEFLSMCPSLQTIRVAERTGDFPVTRACRTHVCSIKCFASDIHPRRSRVDVQLLETHAGFNLSDTIAVRLSSTWVVCFSVSCAALVVLFNLTF
jgi:hypothetical protein